MREHAEVRHLTGELSCRPAKVTAESVFTRKSWFDLTQSGEGSYVAEKVSDVQVQVNELALSMLGWEVQDFRARVTSTCYDDGDCFSKLAISGVFRFNDDDWTECFGYREKHGGSAWRCYGASNQESTAELSGAGHCFVYRFAAGAYA
jgi:hypothetical protein